MTVSHWQRAEQVEREVDFLVVGAGLAGGAAAFFAKQIHGRDVVVTDARDVALGASGRNAGFMISGLDTYYHRAIEQYGHSVAREVWGLSRRSFRHWREFIKNSAFEVPLNNCGSLLLAETAEEAVELELAARALSADKIDIEYSSSDPLKRGYFAAIEQPLDAGVQPYLLAKTVMAQSGAELIANNELYRLEQEEKDTVRVHTRKLVFKARHVMLCTNAYSPMIDPYFVGKVQPTRAQCLVTEPLDHVPVPCCGYSDYGYMYYRSTFDGRFLLGGGRKQHQHEENNTSEDRLNPKVQAFLDRYLQKYFPDVQAPVAQRWSGIMGFSCDGLPLVGTLPGKPRVGFAVGFTGHGLALAAATAERAVDKLLNGVSAGAVDVARFE
ncbi:MAG: FAD-dependent oxidoreductase [Chloroflexota bacterium]|nr:FAD-dependent oxidoreductase [Chloroflexota bacterium]MDE2948577.1 FAD-dependent oxidoreductase [Chloroflexota bacterium]